MGGNVSYTQMASLLSQGAEIKHTKLSESFTYQHYLDHHKDNLMIPLFHVEEKGKIQFCDDQTSSNRLQPALWWRLFNRSRLNSANDV